MTTTLPSVDFRHATLVDAKIGRDIMLVIPHTEALPDSADNIVNQFGANAPLLVCHAYFPLWLGAIWGLTEGVRA